MSSSSFAAQSRPEWTNIRVENPCFSSSRVVFSKKDQMLRIVGSGGHLIGSWDIHSTEKQKPKFQRLRFRNQPELTNTKWERLDSCFTSEHLVETVESTTTSETFLVKWYKKATASGKVKVKTKGIIVFKLYEEGNAVYTNDIGDLFIFLSKSEPFCVPASSFPGMCSNCVEVVDVDESSFGNLFLNSIRGGNISYEAPYYIPPQNIDQYCLELSPS